MFLLLQGLVCPMCRSCLSSGHNRFSGVLTCVPLATMHHIPSCSVGRTAVHWTCVPLSIRWRDDMPLNDMPRRRYVPGHYTPRHYASVTICPVGQYAPVDNMPRWTKCHGGHFAPVADMPRWTHSPLLYNLIGAKPQLEGP